MKKDIYFLVFILLIFTPVMAESDQYLCAAESKEGLGPVDQVLFRTVDTVLSQTEKQLLGEISPLKE